MTKFEVGDRVVCVGEERGEFRKKYYRGSGWKKGLVFTVTTVINVNSDGPECYFGGLHGHGVYVDSLQIATVDNWKKRIERLK